MEERPIAMEDAIPLFEDEMRRKGIKLRELRQDRKRYVEYLQDWERLTLHRITDW